MGFKDEIQNIVKTQEKVKESKYAEIIEHAENRAVNDYNSLKSNLKKEAARMNYKIINGKKVLTAECINVFGYGVIEEILSDAGDLYPPKRHILRCKVVNKPALENYLKKLKQISQEDGIEVTFGGKYGENGKEYYLPIRNESDVNNIYIVSRVTYNITLYLKGTLTLD